MNVYLSGESYVKPVSEGTATNSIYGNFSKNYIAGAVRVAVTEKNISSDIHVVNKLLHINFILWYFIIAALIVYKMQISYFFVTLLVFFTAKNMFYNIKWFFVDFIGKCYFFVVEFNFLFVIYWYTEIFLLDSSAFKLKVINLVFNKKKE